MANKCWYVERGYNPSLPSSRQRFAYALEFEDDGTPALELIMGRRPIEDARDRSGAQGARDRVRAQGKAVAELAAVAPARR